jgi:CHAT domain-containing protein
VEEIATYALDALAGEEYLVTVNQDRLDLIVSVEGPDGSMRSYNSPLQRDEREFVLLEPTSSGLYIVSISSNDFTNALGSHSISVSTSENRAPEDALSLVGWRLMTEGAASSAADGIVAKDAARAAYEAAASVWRQLGNRRDLAQAMYSATMLRYAVLYDPLSCDWLCAADQAAQVAALYRDLGETSLHANAALLQAMALIEAINELGRDAGRRQFDEALTILQETYAYFSLSGNPYELARRKYFAGLAYYNMGELDHSAEAWLEAEHLFEDSGDWMQRFYTRLNLAACRIREGSVGKAIDSLEGITSDARHSADLLFRGAVLDTLAAAHREAGNIDEALQVFSDALVVHRQTDDAHGEASSLAGLGGTYFDSGELRLATEYSRQAMTKADEAGEGRIRAASRTLLGDIAFLEGDGELALEYHQAALDNTSSMISRSFRQALVAKDLAELNRFDEAMQFADQALTTARQANSPLAEADAYLQLGRVLLDSEAFDQSVESLNNALRLYSSLGFEAAQADVYHELALAARAQGDLPAALQHGQASLDRVESLRQRVTAPQLRAFYTSARRGYYETQIDLMMASHRELPANTTLVSNALTVSERSRARMTMDLLNEASVDLYHGVDPDLFDRRSQLLEQLAELQIRQDRLLRPESIGTEMGYTLPDVLAAMTETENQVHLVENEIRAHDPLYSHFASVDYLTATEIQRQIGEDSILLQYSLGEERSYVWVVASDWIQSIELPDRATIEAAAKLAYESLRAPLNSNPLILSELSRLVLEPVLDLIDNKRILVAGDGGLQYIPFSVLPVRSNDGYQPLLATHEVVSIPSISVVAVQRSRPRETRTVKTLAVFADPVLGETDPRLTQARTTNVQNTAEPSRWDASVFGSSFSEGLSRLKGTGYEADVLEELVPEADRLIARGFDASRERLLAEDLSQYRYLHFATHGLIDSERPTLSALALSRFDEQGRSQDGMLRLHDIYNLSLNADLVVLSACETALGRNLHGEALIGLTQGFMYAGARGLIVSLWPVSDRSTAELMTRFYRYLLDEKMRAVEALRSAQLSLAAQRHQSDPFYWGAFVLMGDWE